MISLSGVVAVAGDQAIGGGPLAASVEPLADTGPAHRVRVNLRVTRRVRQLRIGLGLLAQDLHIVQQGLFAKANLRVVRAS